MTKLQKKLTASAPIIVVLTLIVFPLVTRIWSKPVGIIAALIFYEFCCLAFLSWYFIKKGDLRLKDLFAASHSKGRILLLLLTFFPVISNGFIFYKDVPLSGLSFFIIFPAAIAALINGCFEEIYWRGIFTRYFPDNRLWAYIFPTIFFSLNHVSFWLLKDASYPGGFSGIVFGSTMLGVVWGFVAWKTKSIRYLTISHILVNFLGFMIFMYGNF